MGLVAPRTPASGPQRESPELELLAQALVSLRSAADIGTASAIAGRCAADALGTAEHRLLRVDSRSGTLHLLEEFGVATPYLPDQNGPVEWVLRHERAWFDEGQEPATDSQREALLWTIPPAALAVLPIFSGHALIACLVVSCPQPRRFSNTERRLLLTLAEARALALERAELHDRLTDERRARAALEEKMAQSEETSSNLMSAVAHEIRTPLTAIKAYTETLIEGLSNAAAPRERFLGIINDECDHLARLVTDVLDLSRLESGQRPLRLARFDLAAHISDVTVSLSSIASARKIELRVQVAEALVVEADTDLLRRLWINLIGNAIKFSPVSGRVTVTASVSGEQWNAFVDDQGPGIPEEDLPHVFERFYRARQTVDAHVEGTGLGLAIGRGIVELHGGRLWAERSSSGGARFGMSMPMRQTASAEARRIARQVVGRTDLRRLLDETVDSVAAAREAEIVSLMLVDPDRGDLFIAASRGLEGQNLAVRRTTVRAGVAGSVAAWGRPVLVSNIETDRRFLRLNHPQYSTKSLLSVPLRVESEVLGVINVNNKINREAFDDDDLAVLVSLVERVGSAVERAYLYPDSVRAVEEAAETLRQMARLKRQGLLGDHRRVHWARALARAVGLSSAEVDVIGYVATVQDLGMKPLHERFGNKRGPLGPEDRQALARHPEASVEMIRPLEYLGWVRDLILSHHERWDGTGYPRALSGNEIPIGARILGLVDAWESMRCERPYRPARSSQQAREELRNGSGTQFDPDLVDQFLDLLDLEDKQAA